MDRIGISYASLINREAASDRELASVGAKDAFRQTYAAAAKHKAFAQSTTGAWGYSYEYLDEVKAIEKALEKCREYNTLDSKYPCKIINLNGVWAAELE